MKRALYAVLLCGALTGCGFLDYATSSHPNKADPSKMDAPPIFQVAKETVEGGLTGWEAGGLWAGVAGAAFTLFKTVKRTIDDFNATKEANAKKVA
jgi:hypothetical protein